MSLSPEAVSGQIRAHAHSLAEAVVDLHYTRCPEIQRRYGAKGRERCLEDAELHLRTLCIAMEVSRPSLFADYIGWARSVLESRNIPHDDLKQGLEILADVLRDRLSPEAGAALQPYFQSALERLASPSPEIATFLEPGDSLAALRDEYLASLLAGRRDEAARRVLEAVRRGLPLEDGYLRIFQPILYEIGRLWQMNRITAAQEHFCTAATQLIISQFYPQIFAAPRAGRRAVVACVGGDLHELGARTVADLLELSGWDACYLGANAPAPAVVQMVVERGASLLALSVTMMWHLRQLRDTTAAVRAHPACQQVKILVGGRPFLLEPELWKDVGADGWAQDGREAVDMANRLVQGG